MKKLSELNEADIKGKKILLRVNFDLPVEKGKISDTYRVESHKETVNRLIHAGAKIALLSHISAVDSYETHVEEISHALEHDLHFISEIDGKSASDALDQKEIVLIENVRQKKEEKENDDDFAKSLVVGFDMYINDAFAVSHRAHASVVAITKHIESVMGLLIENEVKNLKEAINAPKAGKTLILGGAKISTKLPVIKNFTDKADDIFVGGALLNNFLKYSGLEVGKSLVDDDDINLIGEIDTTVLNLPRDVVTSKAPDGSQPSEIHFSDKVPSDQYILDVGPESASHFCEIIRNSSLVIWNGPLGLFEVDQFAQATKKIAQAVIDAKHSFVGGGDTIAALHELGLAQKIDHISTGGGAMLAFLGGARLPALEALGYYQTNY